MDIMALQISRSGNYRSQPDYVQAIFPDRESSVQLGHGPSIYFPIGKSPQLSIPKWPSLRQASSKSFRGDAAACTSRAEAETQCRIT